VSDVSEVSARERLRWLRRTAKRWLLAIVLLVVATLVGASWSYGVFTATSANPRNVVTAGSMTQSNSADNAAIMGTDDLVPGDVVEGTATIQNVGGARGDFALTVTDLVDTPGPHGGDLSERLMLEVFEDERPQPIYDGPLPDLDADLGTWEIDEERDYRFVVTFRGSSSGTSDNAFQGSSATATFTWHAVQSH
jgi:hypothetical protein